MDEQQSAELEKLHRCFPQLIKSRDILALADDAPRGSGVRWRLLTQVLVDAVLAEDRRHIPLGETVPTLRKVGDFDIALPPPGRLTPLVWDTRAINRLRRHSCHRWADLAELTPHDLAVMPHAGPMTVYEIVAQVLTFVWDSDTAAGRDGEPAVDLDDRLFEPRSRTRVGGVIESEWAESEDKALWILWAWASREKQVRNLADFVRLVSSVRGTWPEDVRAAIKHLGEIPLRAADAGSDPIVLIKDWLDAHDGRARGVVERRLFTGGKRATFDELARGYGVTRERMRQIEGQVLARLEEWKHSAEALPVRWRAVSIREYVGPWCVVDKGLAALVGHEEQAEDCLDSPQAALLLSMAGPYRRDGKYLSRYGFTLPPIDTVASETGLIDLDAYRNLLAEAGVLPVWHEAAIEAHAASVRKLSGALYAWSGRLASKAVAVLAAIGQPASADEIANVFDSGMTANRIRNVLSTDARVVRSGKNVWALVEWGFEEYSGIAEEIRERLEAVGGGPLRLRSLIDELVDAFGVSESSVRMYSDAPAFVVSNGLIHLRTSDDPYPAFTDVSRVRGVYLDGRALIAHVALDAGIIRNGSCYVHRVIAGRLGVVPGGRVAYSWGEYPVQLHWPLTSATGPLLTGLRPVFDEHAVNPGDVLRIRFDPVDEQLTAHRVDGDAVSVTDQVARLRALTGVDLLEAHDIEEQVAGAIEVQTSRVRDALRDRGDEVAAAIIPFRIVTETTNDELAAIFGDLDRELGFE